MMTTSTTTAHQLEEVYTIVSGPGSTIRPTRVVSHHNVAATRPGEQFDSVLEESRIADSTVPDGGIGWVILACCAVISWWVIANNYTWGIYQSALFEKGVGDSLKLSFVGSLAPAAMAATGIFNARIMRTIGMRNITMIGIGGMGITNILASFAADHLIALFFFPGLFMGLSMGACFMSYSAMPAQYFLRKRGLANGIVCAGGGVGGAVMSIASNAMIERYGMPWAFRITGLALLATGLPAAWFVKQRLPFPRVGFVDRSLLLSPNFGILFVACAISVFPLFVPPYFIPQYSKSIGLSPHASAALLAGFNFASALGRIVSGQLSDIMGPLNTMVLFLLINALSMLALWPASTSLPPLTVFAIINGLTNGAVFSCVPTAVGNLFGSVRVSVAMGMMVAGWTVGYLVGSPVAGALLDAYGGPDAGLNAYHPAMFYAGGVCLLSAVLLGYMRFRISRKMIAKV